MPSCRFPLSVFTGFSLPPSLRVIRSTTVATPHFSKDPTHCRHWPRTFFAESVPLRYSTRCENKNLDFFATFLRLGTPFHPDNAAISLYTAIFAAFLGSNPRLRSLQQSLIAKKLQFEPFFCFSVPLQKVQGGIGEGTAQARRCRMIQVRRKFDVAG